MSDERDLLGAADALLHRHAPAHSSPDDDAVPTLTELIAPGQRAAPSPPPASDAFTREIVAEVVAQVEARLARDLERRLTQHLVTEVQAAVVAALGDLRQDVANAVGDAVAEALSRRPPR
jgi:hypothetical protein